MEDLIAINEEGLDKLALSIYDYSERINNIFNQIDDLIIQSKEYFDCQLNNDMYIKYQSIIDSIKNVKLNISSYSTDLIKVKNSFRNDAQMISADIKKQTSNIQSNYE